MRRPSRSTTARWPVRKSPTSTVTSSPDLPTTAAHRSTSLPATDPTSRTPNSTTSPPTSVLLTDGTITSHPIPTQNLCTMVTINIFVNTMSECPECNGWLDDSGEETFCHDCGLVVAVDHVDRGPEWRSFEDGPDRKRTGAPLTRSRHDRGLSTEIDRSTRLTGRRRRPLARLRRQHNRARIASKAEGIQVYAFTEIRRIVGALGLSESVRDRSCVLFESAQNEDLLRGRSLEGFAAATIYALCRVDRIS